MSKSRENMSKSRENMSKSRESLSKSLRADSREDVSQSSLSEPASKNLSKMTFLNVTNKIQKLATIDEPGLNSQSTHATLLPGSKLSHSFGNDLELELEIPQDRNISLESSNSSNNMLLTYAATPPFMESLSSNYGKFSETTKSNVQKRLRPQLSTNSVLNQTHAQFDQNGYASESAESFKPTPRNCITRQNAHCSELPKIPGCSLENNGTIESHSYVPTFASKWSSFTQSSTETN